VIFIPTVHPEVVLIQPKIYTDSRGFFLETYRSGLFSNGGINANFVQENHSGSPRGVLRGLHYQIRQPQGKLVRVVSGEIYDVALDIRRSSPRFGQHVGITLNSETKEQIWIPTGFAHGFYVLSEWAEVIYKNTDYYAPEWERSILWNDPVLSINWPLEAYIQPVISTKDADGVLFKDAETFE